MKAGFLGAALLAFPVFAASYVEVVADRLANETNDYVYVVADGDFGYAPGSREAIVAAVNAGADIVALHVRKGADGQIVTGERTTLLQALSAMGRKTLAMVDGFEEFPQELVDVYRKSRGGCGGLLLNMRKPPFFPDRKRSNPAGLEDPSVRSIWNSEILLVPTVSADGGNLKMALATPYVRLVEVSARRKDLDMLDRARAYKGWSKLMLDTTSDEACADHGDARALADPDRNWGWCLKQGARAIRTRRPAELCRYLERCGRRTLYRHGPVVPYAAEAGARVSLVPTLVPAPREMTVGRGLVPVETKIETKRDATLPKEGYRLEVGLAGIEIAAADDDGEYWAHRTLEQLRGEVNGAAYYPVVSIRDWPQFAWRGALLDDSRHFIGKEGVKTFIDGMSRHKLNVFHWHPDDDPGWRLPLRGFPDLRKYGSAMRKRDGSLYGPYSYTEEDVKEIVAYARERHVRIVPEFEIPGHNRALVCSYPEICCESARPKGKEHPAGGGSWDETAQANVICAGDDEAIRTVERMLDAFCELFPDSDMIHVGGDEVNPRWWRNCPKCQARIKALGLKDEKGLQSWLMRHFVKHLAARGRKAIGWDEIVDGGIPEGMSVMYWRWRLKTNQVATSNRTEIVACPSSHCYFDNDQLILHDRFGSWGSCRLPRAYSYDPYQGIAPEFRRYVVGTEGLLWGEGIRTAEELLWKAYPRLCATAEIAWTCPPPPRDYDGLLRRLGTHIPRLRAWGIGSAHTPELIPGPPQAKAAQTKAAQANPPQCKIVIDMPKPKDGGGFACGEKIDVRIRVLCDGKAVATNAWVALDNWGPGVVRKAAVEKIPAEGLLVRGVTLDRPGCLRCEVRIRERHALASVPFEPQAIRSGSPLPPDFMDWWRGEIARLDATVPAEVELTPWATAATNRFDCWRVRCPTAGGKSVHGLLTVPKDRSKGPFPVHVSVPGAGVGEPYDQSKIGYAHWPDNGRVRLTIFAHCAQIDIPEVRREYAERMLKEHREKYGLKGNYVVAGISESREAYHYYPIILGANRLVNWLVRQPYSDPKDVIYSGTSQGGGMGLVLSALNPSFTRVFLNVPAMCDTMGSLQGRQSGWPQPVERQVPGNRAAAARNAPYFDGANFARFIKCPIRIGCGWADTICPSPGTMAVYNNIPAADKAIVGVPHAGHGVVIPRCDAWLYGSRHVPPFDRETTHVIASTPDP